MQRLECWLLVSSLALVAILQPAESFSVLVHPPRLANRISLLTTTPESRSLTKLVRSPRTFVDLVAADTRQAIPNPFGPLLLQTGLVVAAAAASAFTRVQIGGVPIAESLFALVAGIVTVAAAAAAVDEATAANIPQFDPSGQRFDQSKFGGRYCKMILACDPRLLLYSREQVQQCKSMVESYRSVADGTDSTNRALWDAKRVVDSALRAEAGTWIPRPFRMSGYVPFNGPICIGMVAMSQSIPALLFWAWLNQSQNALINFYNRNASSELSTKTLFMSYAAAVGSALAVAFSLSTFVNGHFAGEEAARMLRFVAFPSAVAASSLNCYIVRRPEISAGIPLLDSNLKDVLQGETSQAAAAKGVYSTTASRAVLQIPTVFIAPLLLETVAPLKAFVLAHPASAVPLTVYLLLVSFGIGLPATVGLFPQMSKLDADKAEDKFQNLKDPKTNKPYEEFYFNKGL